MKEKLSRESYSINQSHKNRIWSLFSRFGILLGGEELRVEYTTKDGSRWPQILCPLFANSLGLSSLIIQSTIFIQLRDFWFHLLAKDLFILPYSFPCYRTPSLYSMSFSTPSLFIQAPSKWQNKEWAWKFFEPLLSDEYGFLKFRGSGLA